MAIQPTLSPRRDGLSKALTIGGAVAGGIYAGPQGAAMGAGLGQTAAGLAQKPQQAPVESQGMARRQQALQQDPLVAIQQAQAALQTLPPEQFPEVRQAFNNAMAIAQRNQQLGRGQV